MIVAASVVSARAAAAGRSQFDADSGRTA